MLLALRVASDLTDEEFIVSVLFENGTLVIESRLYLENDDVREIFRRLPGIYCR